MGLLPKASYKGRSMATQKHVQRLRDRGSRYSKHGTKLHTSFQSDKAQHDGRIAPNRRWFGNTRVVSQRQLEEFRAEVERRSVDPKSVILRERMLPMSLLEGPKKGTVRGEVVNRESFERTFGRKAQRTRPNIAARSMEEMVAFAAAREEKYDEENDRDTTGAQEARAAVLNEAHEAAFGRAQTMRVFAELYKVIDCSDVVIQVLDARDPMGTRSAALEAYLRNPENRHKHMILLLNKTDLVPPGVTRKWISLLSQEYPTIAYRSSIEKPFGKGALIGLLRQFARLHREKKSITIGLVGYPNVGKSSLVNSLVGKPACTVAPVPGETKVWQYVNLTQAISLVDCPGVVHPDRRTANVDLLLRGVIRPEKITQPSAYISELLDRVDPTSIARTYNLPALDVAARTAALAERAERQAEIGDDTPLPTLPGDNEAVYWIDGDDFLERLALRTGRLLQGAQPDVETMAVAVLRDWQRGRIPFFYPPPNATEADAEDTAELRESDMVRAQAGNNGIEEQAALEAALEVEKAEQEEKEAEAEKEEQEQSGSGSYSGSEDASGSGSDSDSESGDEIDWTKMFRRNEPRLLEEEAEAEATGASAAGDAAGRSKRIHARDITLHDSTMVDLAAKKGRRVRTRVRAGTASGRPEGPRLSRRVNLADDVEYISKRQTSVPKTRYAADDSVRAQKQAQRKAASTKRKTGDLFYAEARKKREIIAKKVGHKIA